MLLIFRIQIIKYNLQTTMIIRINSFLCSYIRVSSSFGSKVLVLIVVNKLLINININLLFDKGYIILLIIHHENNEDNSICVEYVLPKQI